MIACLKCSILSNGVEVVSGNNQHNTILFKKLLYIWSMNNEKINNMENATVISFIEVLPKEIKRLNKELAETNRKLNGSFVYDANWKGIGKTDSQTFGADARIIMFFYWLSKHQNHTSKFNEWVDYAITQGYKITSLTEKTFKVEF